MTEPSVEDRLYAAPFAFDFFQAVRLLHRLAPDRPVLGAGGPPGREVVRLTALQGLTFPASAIHDLQRGGKDEPPKMLITFLGLTGPSGVMPRHFTDLIMRLERERRGEERRALRDWFDLFNHRFASLFYRAWEKYRFWVWQERLLGRGAEPDPFTAMLSSFVGLNLPGLRDRLHVSAVEFGGEPRRVLAKIEDLSLLYYGGLLSSRHRHAEGLRQLVGDYFGLAVAVIQFRPSWLCLEPANQTRLGLEEGNASLGVDTVIGERVGDVQGKFRLRLGPLSYDRFQHFLPDRSPVPEHKGFFLLTHLVRLYVGPALDFDVQLVLRSDEVPECRLGGDETPGPRLGWNTWLTSQQPGRDADEAVFEAVEVVRVEE